MTVDEFNKKYREGRGSVYRGYVYLYGDGDICLDATFAQDELKALLADLEKVEFENNG